MATSVQLTQDKDLECKNLSESGQGQYHIYARGTGLNNSGNRILTINGSNVYNTGGRGMRLTVYNSSMSQISDTTYDIYGSNTARTNLANALNGLSSSNIFILTSYDAIRSNSNLDSAMNSLDSRWWTDPMFSDYGVRKPYTAIGIKRLGMLSEQMWGDGSGDPYAEIDWTYEDYSAAGTSGYGPALYQFIGVDSHGGTGYGYHYSPWIYYSNAGVSDHEYLRLTAELKVDIPRAQNGGRSRIYLYDRSPGDGWVSSTAKGTTSTQWEKIELLFRRDDSNSSSKSSDGLASDRVRVGVYHYPSSNDVGTSYVRNIQVQKCGFSPNNSNLKTKISANIITSPEIYEGPQMFSPIDPDAYYSLWNSNKNLVKDDTYSAELSGGASDEDVYWFDRTLTANNQKIVHWKNSSADQTGENMYTSTNYHSIDHTKLYYGAIWMYCHYKSAGNNYFGNNANPTDILNPSGTSNGNPYMWIEADQSIEKGVWTLVEGWFFPSGTSSTYMSNWESNFSRQFGQVNNGGFGPRLNYINTYKFDTTNDTLRLRWLDYYNNANKSKTWWALPLLVQVNPMDIKQGGFLSSHQFKEIL